VKIRFLFYEDKEFLSHFSNAIGEGMSCKPLTELVLFEIYLGRNILSQIKYL
jgi:hypothetical protein